MSIRSAFYSFGRSLKLKFDDLRAIREDYLKDSDVEIALENVLVLWLDQKYDVKKHGLPCWRALVKAVDSEAGGNNHELAVKIASNHRIGNDNEYLHGCMYALVKSTLLHPHGMKPPHFNQIKYDIVIIIYLNS